MLVAVNFLCYLLGTGFVARYDALGKIVHRLFYKHQFLFVEL